MGEAVGVGVSEGCDDVFFCVPNLLGSLAVKVGMVKDSDDGFVEGSESRSVELVMEIVLSLVIKEVVGGALVTSSSEPLSVETANKGIPKERCSY